MLISNLSIFHGSTWINFRYLGYCRLLFTGIKKTFLREMAIYQAESPLASIIFIRIHNKMTRYRDKNNNINGRLASIHIRVFQFVGSKELILEFCNSQYVHRQYFILNFMSKFLRLLWSSRMPYYAVGNGRRPGIYQTWYVIM